MNDNSVFSTSVDYLRISPQKINIVARFINSKHLKLNDLISLLYNKGMLLKKGGRIILKLISSIEKKIKKEGKDSNSFFVKNISINKSLIRKKVFYRARGITNMIRNRYSSINIVVSE